MAKMYKNGKSNGMLGKFVPLPFYMLDSLAWKSLRPSSQATYIAIARRYDGSNNGRIAVSNRELAERIHYSRQTASVCVRELIEKRFITVVTPSSFDRKVKRAAEYRLELWPCDVTGERASKEFMKWKP